MLLRYQNSSDHSGNHCPPMQETEILGWNGRLGLEEVPLDPHWASVFSPMQRGVITPSSLFTFSIYWF